MNCDTVLLPEFTVQTSPEESTATPTGVFSEPNPATGDLGVAAPNANCARLPLVVLFATQKERPSEAIPAGLESPVDTGLTDAGVPAEPLALNSPSAPPMAVPVVKPVTPSCPPPAKASATGPCSVPSVSVLLNTPALVSSS